MDQHQLSPEEKKLLIRELFTRGDLTPIMHNVQKEIYNAIQELPQSVREIVVFSSRRLGKSFLGCLMAIQDCLQHDSIIVSICGPNLKQTRKIVVPLIKQIASFAPDGLIKETKSELTWTIGNSQIIITAFDTASESIRGMGLSNIYLEESGLSNPNEYSYVLNSVLKPTLMHSKKTSGLGRIISLTTPSRHIEHDLHTITIPQAQANNAFFKYTILDNPLLSKEEIQEEIQSLGGINSIAVQTELFCNITRDTSIVVVPEFDKQIHIQNVQLPEYFKPQITIDFGGTRDKTCALYHYWDYLQSKYVIYDELHWDNQTQTNTIITDIKNKWKDWSTAIKYVDSPGQLKIDLGSQYNYSCISVSKLKFDESIASLRKPFHEDNIVINSTCSFLISTLENGTFNSNRNDFARTTALGHMDALAGLTYAIRHTNKSNPIPPVKASNNTYSEHQEGHPLLSIFN